MIIDCHPMLTAEWFS